MRSFKEFLEDKKRVVKRHICYLDDNGNVVDKENATNCIITEYDSNGEIINSVHGSCKKNNDLENKEER